jgi:DNA-binding MarR family transcriptional regulator
MPEETAAAASDALTDVLVQTSFEVIAIVTRVAAEHDLSLTSVRMLGILRDRTLTMAQLADYLGLERSTVSGLVDRAEKRGLVARRASAADGRSTELVITDAGQELAALAGGNISVRIAPIVERMPADLHKSLPAILAAISPSHLG